MPMTTPAGSIDDARQFFADAGLAFPPVPAALEASVVKQGEAIFGTRPAEPPLYTLEAWVAEAMRGPEFVLFGMDGHGINSWATHFYLVHGPLAILMQVAAGGALMSTADTATRVEGAWESVAALMDDLNNAQRAGKLPAGKRLVVVDSDLGNSRWAWVDLRSNAEPQWETSEITATFAAANDVARLTREGS